MGNFSVECLGCGHSLRPQDATERQSRWMMHVVAVLPTGACVRGVYDGYGSILSSATGQWESLLNHDTVAAYHRACWVLLGQPRDTKQNSPSAVDQGYFCATQPDVPMTVEDLARLRDESEAHARMAQDSYIAALQAVTRKLRSP